MQKVSGLIRITGSYFSRGDITNYDEKDVVKEESYYEIRKAGRVSYQYK